MIKAIFFDMGGVICEEGFKPCPKAYEKEFGVPANVFYTAIHDHQAWKDFTLGKVSEEEYLKVCKERLPKPYVFDGKRYGEIVNELTKPNEELIRLIKEELAKKYIIGIVSNHPEAWFERFLDKTGLREIVKVKAVSCYQHIRKPDKELFDFAVKNAGVKPEECIYVDDRPDRIGGAEELGIKVVVFDGNMANFKKLINKFN